MVSFIAENKLVVMVVPNATVIFGARFLESICVAGFWYVCHGPYSIVSISLYCAFVGLKHSQ